MPLTRANVTVASRIMLPTYVLLGAAVAVVYITDPGSSLSGSRALRFQNDVLPWPTWGVVMGGMSAGMLVALLTHNRGLFSFMLAMYATTWLVWGATWTAGIFYEGATPLGPLFCAFIFMACTATIASLVRGDSS